MTLRYFLRSAPDGKILQISALDALDPTEWHGDEISYADSETLNSDIGGYYMDGTSIRAKGIPASPHHTFNYTTKQWALDLSAAWYAVRRQRDKLLASSDWTQLPDVPITTKAAWAVYRQALRDVTQQVDPLAIVWPKQP